MRIKIKSDEFKLNLWFPLSILKTKLGCKIFSSAMQGNVGRALPTNDVSPTDAANIQAQTPVEQKEFVLPRKQMKEIYKALKKHIKAHGHFALIDVQAADGTKVKISV